MGSKNAILKNSPHNTQDLLFSSNQNSNILYLACPLEGAIKMEPKKLKILFPIQMALISVLFLTIYFPPKIQYAFVYIINIPFPSQMPLAS
jgi:hypothetical protein